MTVASSAMANTMAKTVQCYEPYFDAERDLRPEATKAFELLEKSANQEQSKRDKVAWIASLAAIGVAAGVGKIAAHNAPKKTTVNADGISETKRPNSSSYGAMFAIPAGLLVWIPGIVHSEDSRKYDVNLPGQAEAFQLYQTYKDINNSKIFLKKVEVMLNADTMPVALVKETKDWLNWNVVGLACWNKEFSGKYAQYCTGKYYKKLFSDQIFYAWLAALERADANMTFCRPGELYSLHDIVKGALKEI